MQQAWRSLALTISQDANSGSEILPSGLDRILMFRRMITICDHCFFPRLYKYAAASASA